MSTTGSPVPTLPITSDSVIDSNRDGHQALSFPSPNTSHDSDSTPTQTPRNSQTSRLQGDINVSMSTGGNEDNDRNVGLGTGTPIPPAPILSSPHAEAMHSQASSVSATNDMSELPSTMAGSGPRSVPSLAPSPPLASPRRPSPPLPSLPPPQRPAQVAVSRSSVGTSVPGRSLSFLDPHSRSASGSVRAHNGSGAGYNNQNVSRNACRNCDHRTISSFATSAEKASALLDTDASRVFQLDFNNNDGSRDSRHYNSRVGIPVPVLIPDGKEQESGTRLSRPQFANTDGGDGGGGGGLPDGMKLSRDGDSIRMPHFPRTVQERLQPTIDHAMVEEAKYARKAKYTGYALNVAIGLQVFLSAFITGLSAVTSGRQTQIVTSILGGLGTVVASYLARARGSNEPELSIARTKDLQRFMRTCDAFVQDHGQETGFEDSEGKEGTKDLRRARDLDNQIKELRTELEHLLGNGDGERRLSPPV